MGVWIHAVWKMFTQYFSQRFLNTVITLLLLLERCFMFFGRNLLYPFFRSKVKSPGAALCTQFARSTVGVSVNEQLKQGPRP